MSMWSVFYSEFLESLDVNEEEVEMCNEMICIPEQYLEASAEGVYKHV